MGIIIQPGEFVDSHCPLDWAHPLNYGLLLDTTILPNAGWSRGVKLRDLRRGAKSPYDGTLTNGALWKGNQGRPGGFGSVYFDGSNDYVTFGDQAAFDVGTGNMTIAFWARNGTGNTANDYPAMISKTDYVGTNDGFVLWVRNTTDMRTYNGSAESTVDGSFTVGAWIHYLITKIGSAMVAYKNGAQLTTWTENRTYTSTDSFNLGGWGDLGGPYWNGSLDAVRFWNRGLSPRQAVWAYLQSRAGDPERLRWVSSKAWSIPATGGGTTIQAGMATETDSALAEGKTKTRDLGLSTETDSSLARGAAKSRSVGVATETDAALTLAGSKSRAVGVSTETDAAQSLGRTKTAALGLATETDSALALSTSKGYAAAVSTETDSALALTGSKAKALGVSTETDSALSLGATKARSTGLSTETDSALPLTGSKSIAAGISTETDSAFGLSATKTRSIGRSDETDAALALGAFGQIFALETDTAFALAATKTKSLGLATESDSAFALSASKMRAVQTAIEADIALSLSRSKQSACGMATEVDTALALSGSGGGSSSAAAYFQRYILARRF